MEELTSAIGGYFELELQQTEEYHKNAIALNTGRNAMEYVLRAKKYKKVYLPFYTCDVMLEPIKKLDLVVEYYNIDETFRPVFDFTKMISTDVFVYTNYFGICDNQVQDVANQCNNLIVDNSQAFFAKPLQGVDTFYSARKFFGVSDGAYLYTNTSLGEELETDLSYQRFEHLLGRIDGDAESFYTAFKNNDDFLINQPIKKMSKLTQRLLSSINYPKIANKRKQNFEYLQTRIHSTNLLSFNLSAESVPMVYPYLVENGADLKRELINNKIFVATYWPNVLQWSNYKSLEFKLTDELIALPVDQRYEQLDMKKILGMLDK